MKLQTPQGPFRNFDAVLSAGTAAAYDGAGASYVAYADGAPATPFEFGGALSYADREVWRRIDAKLMSLAATGSKSLKIFDAGCGPGTWLRRIALRARELGFAALELRGLDISPKMVALAQEALVIGGISLDVRITVGELSEKLPYARANFDISLCLYGVFNHLSIPAQQTLAAQLARITRDTVFVSVRTAGSLPTIYVDGLSKARSYHQDNDTDWMEVDMNDGRHLSFPSHLFTCQEFRALFDPHLASMSFTGLDVFRSRFAADPHWNPSELAGQPDFDEQIDRLEKSFASDPSFIDRAAHILLVGECRAPESAPFAGS
jgi:SAM-dependent methyltransferase